MVNSKKYIDDPRVHISTRLSVKNELADRFPRVKGLNKKLKKLLSTTERGKNAISTR